MKGDWLAAFEALKDCYINDGYSNIAINEAVERHRDCSSGFVRAFAKGVLRESLRLDYCIDRLAAKGKNGIKNRTLIILRMGIYAIDSLDSVPDHAAVNEAVSLAKKTSKGSDRFVNALLRRYIRERDDLAIPDDRWDLKYSFPSELIELIRAQYGEETERILAGLNAPPELVLRANTNKISREQLVELAGEAGIKLEISGENAGETALLCREGQAVSSKLFREGFYSIQSMSSIIAIEAFSPKKGAKVLDMCAAPGGKSCAMAEIMGDSGEITACDIHMHRLELIKTSATRLGLKSIKTELLDGTEYRDEFEAAFDYVLSDVPCSGLGVVGSKPELKLRTDVTRYGELIEIQKKILENAYRYTKDGGELMYSTCTINKEENDAVIEDFMKKYPSAEIIEKRTMLPYNEVLVGFFYCKIRKNA